MWDTWIYHHRNTFHLYYLTKAFGQLDGVGLAISRDGVTWLDRGKVIEKTADATWLGSGAVWPVMHSAGQEERFIMNFSEWRGDESLGRQTIFFAESSDLVHWTPLGASHEFRQDTRWYERNGRWDNIWPVSRPGGGYWGYWAATPKDRRVGFGFGASADGVSWQACEPALLDDVPWGMPEAHSPEVAAVHRWQDKYYALAGLDDLEPFVLGNDFADFRPGQTTFIADSPAGPFVPAAKNRRLLVGNSSYFTRFVDTPDGVLVNHHSWELRQGAPLNVDDDTVCMAPLKRAVWDDEGTLRLKWWERNEEAKARQVNLESPLIETAFDLAETLIVEGVMSLTSSPIGIYLQGTNGRGTGFLVRADGGVECGDIDDAGTGFERKGHVDRELALEHQAEFRLLRRGRLTEFYLNDYLMHCYCLPARGTGRIDLIGPAADFHDVQAWYCAHG